MRDSEKDWERKWESVFRIFVGKVEKGVRMIKMEVWVAGFAQFSTK